MTRTPEEPEREHRIDYEAVVDAYNEEELDKTRYIEPSTNTTAQKQYKNRELR